MGKGWLTWIYSTKDFFTGIHMLYSEAKEISRRAKKYSPIETGGVIIGHYTSDMRFALISEMTSRFIKQDECKRDELVIDTILLNEYLKVLWERPNRKINYLGDWHSHTSMGSYPSPRDEEMWLRVQKEDPDFHPVYFIIGGDLEPKDLIPFIALTDSLKKMELIGD